MAIDLVKKRARQKAYRERHRELVLSRSRAHTKAWRMRNRDAVIAAERARWAANRAELNLRHRTARASRRDVINARRRERYAERAETVRANYRAWLAANRDTVNKQRRKRYAANPNILLVARNAAAKREAIKRKTEIQKIDYEKVIRAAAGMCQICFKPFDLFGIHIDHIIPLARGGTHTYDNLQATHAFCNMSKGAKVG